MSSTPRLTSENMARTRKQSTLSRSGSDSASDSDESVLTRSPSPNREPPEHIPRPSNSFLLYRSYVLKKRQKELQRIGRVENMANYGRFIGPKWNSEPPHVKAYWHGKAEKARIEHRLKYPDYQYRPNRRPKAERGPKRAQRKSKRQATERKAETPSPTERSVKTRSMVEQKEVSAAWLAAQERKTNEDSRHQTTTHPGDCRETRSMSRSASVQSDVAHPEAAKVQDQTTSTMAQTINHQGPVEPQPVGLEPGLLSDSVLQPRPSMFDLLSAPALAPVLDYASLAHGRQAPPETFNENVVPIDPDFVHTGHDRPSLWDSEFPLFPREVLEEDYRSSYYETRCGPAHWNHRPLRQTTFLLELAPYSSQPLTSSLFVNWPLGGWYLGQQLGPFPESQELKGGMHMHE